MAEIDSMGKPVGPWTYYHDIDEEGRMMRGGVDLMGQPPWMRTGPPPDMQREGGRPPVQFIGGFPFPNRDFSFDSWPIDRRKKPTPLPVGAEVVGGDEGPPAPYQAVVPDEFREQYKLRDKYRDVTHLGGDVVRYPRLGDKERAAMSEAAWSDVPRREPHPSTPDVGYGPSVSAMSPKQVKKILADMLRAKEEQRKQSLPR